MLDDLASHARQAAPAGVDHWAVRGVSERSQRLMVRQDIPQSPSLMRDEGAMVTVIAQGGLGYAATSDTSVAGLQAAFARALTLAKATAGHTVFNPSALRMPQPRGRYDSVVATDSAQMSLPEKIDLLRAVSAATHVDERIVDWQASLWTVHTDQLHLTSEGACAEQHWQMLTPAIQATAQVNGITQTRSSAGQYNGFCQQGGLEVIDRSGFRTDGPRVAHEAIELALAAPCPSGTMDIVLMPDQMMLQIHESIGHPLELDRILGDERNFAGTSFVTLDMFGQYQYGSALLNVSHDPQQAHEFAGFAFDDDGTPAQRQRIIEGGIPSQPRGGAIAQPRAKARAFDLGGPATTRA